MSSGSMNSGSISSGSISSGSISSGSISSGSMSPGSMSPGSMRSGDALVQVHHGDRFPEGLPSPDVYFLPGYGQAASLADDGEWILLEAFDGAWQVPLIMRTLADGARDAISPYGYSGVYASPSLSAAQIGQAWSATIERLRKLGVISVLLRHSPLVTQAPEMPEMPAMPEMPEMPGMIPVLRGHPTIVLEPADSDSAWSGLAGTCRTRIRKAIKNGYTSDVRQASSEDLAPFSDFRRLYEGTMARLDAAPLYFFSDQYYKGLLESLSSNLLIAEVRDAAGVPVSSALLMRHGHMLHYHLAGSSPDDARLGTNNLMMWTATQFAVGQGLRQFHLGGGLRGRDGLFHFKHTFGGRELEYSVSGLIVDDEPYRTHTQNRATECGITADALSASGFFPAYRGGVARV
jgi:serine/alanine adding enzyme